jgi:hypothetical protein
MRFLRNLSFLVLASGMALAQASSGGQAQNSSTSDELKALREAIAAQQAQIAQQQKQLETLEKALAEKNATPRVENAALTTPNTPATVVAQADVEKPKESPVSFRIGGTDFTPGGFVDFSNVFRSENTGNVISTAFNAIPFSNTPQGQTPEFRSSGQYSRISMKITGKYGANNVMGYIETDFNGNDAANVFTTTNPHTFRLRLFYVNVRRGKWEFTGGQAWGLMTPNRVGVSPNGTDLALPGSTDGNIHAGVYYSRDGQLRIAFKPNDKFSWAFAAENPQQITAGQVTTPSAFPAGAQLASQLDGNATPGVPNAFPDLVTKLAYDTKLGARAFHLEAGGMITSVKLTVQPAGPTGTIPAGTPFSKHTKIGSGLMGGLNLEATKKLRVLAYGMYGPGVGRYFIGSGPQYVVAPVALTPTSFDVAISMVHAGSGYGGIEFKATPKTTLGAYYGGIYYGRNSFQDASSPAVTKPFIGFGGPGSASSNNRAIQEGSFVITQTLWSNPQFGALVLINDASYNTRAPWAHAATAPKNAHLFMDHLVLRYIIP